MTLTQFSMAFSNTGISCLRQPFCGPYTAVAPDAPSSGLVTSVATSMTVSRRWGQMSGTERSETDSIPLMKVGMSLFLNGLLLVNDQPRAVSIPKPPSLVPLPPMASSIFLTPYSSMTERITMPSPYVEERSRLRFSRGIMLSPQTEAISMNAAGVPSLPVYIRTGTRLWEPRWLTLSRNTLL